MIEIVLGNVFTRETPSPPALLFGKIDDDSNDVIIPLNSDHRKPIKAVKLTQEQIKGLIALLQTGLE